MHSRYIFCLPALLALLVGAGCRGKAPDPAMKAGLSILCPYDMSGYTQVTERVLLDAFPEAKSYPLQKWNIALEEALREKRILLVTDSASLPSDLWSKFEDFVDRGGIPVFLGSKPFEQRVWSSPGGIKTERQLVSEWAAQTRAADALPPVKTWRLLCGKKRSSGILRVAEHPDLPWPGVVVTLDKRCDHDSLTHAAVDEGSPEHQGNALIFYARGDAATTQIALQCTDVDGVAWRRSLRVTEKWTPFLLRLESFEKILPTNGTEFLTMNRLKRIDIAPGPDSSFQGTGSHGFGISDVRIMTDPRPRHLALDWPGLPMVSTPQDRYPCQPRTVHLLDSDDVRDVWGDVVGSTLRGSLGLGGNAGDANRWIPIAEARNANREVLGWPAAVHVRSSGDGPDRVLGWVGVDISPSTGELAKSLLLALVAKLERRHFLVSAGMDRFVLDHRESFEVVARLVRSHGLAGDVRLAVELVRPNGQTDRRVLVDLDDNTFRVSMGNSPAAPRYSEDWHLKLSLLDRKTRQVLDVMEQPFKLLPDRTDTAAKSWVTCVGPVLAVEGRTLYPLGVHYQPAGPVRDGRRWLAAGHFDPEAVRRDLERLGEIGINTIAVSYGASEDAPQLRYVLDEAMTHRMRVLVVLEPASTGAATLDVVKDMVAKARLGEEPTAFALDLSVPIGNLLRQRIAGDLAWEEWLTEQFGSHEKARAILGGDPFGALPDVDVEEAAPLRHAKRRFLNDMASRVAGSVINPLRSIGTRQLLTARGLTSMAGEFSDPAAGAVHLDFMTPDAGDLHLSQELIMDAGFVTAYCRGMSAGKPVVWIGLGKALGRPPAQADLTGQLLFFDQAFTMCRLSRAAGCFAAAFAPGPGTVDKGLVHGDGTWRPVAESFRSFAHGLRETTPTPAAWRGRTFGADASSLGFASLWSAWRNDFESETRDDLVEELRPSDFGTLTSTLAAVRTNGAPVVPLALMNVINAEWVDAYVGAQPADRDDKGVPSVQRMATCEVELLNTGPATLAAGRRNAKGSAWVKILSPGGRETLLPAPALAWGQRARFAWTPDEAGDWTLRLALEGVGEFGERLVVRVVP